MKKLLIGLFILTSLLAFSNCAHFKSDGERKVRYIINGGRDTIYVSEYHLDRMLDEIR